MRRAPFLHGNETDEKQRQLQQFHERNQQFLSTQSEHSYNQSADEPRTHRMHEELDAFLRQKAEGRYRAEGAVRAVGAKTKNGRARIPGLVTVGSRNLARGGSQIHRDAVEPGAFVPVRCPATTENRAVETKWRSEEGQGNGQQPWTAVEHHGRCKSDSTEHSCKQNERKRQSAGERPL